MARIWQEGFEDGLPNTEYLEGTSDSQYLYGSTLYKFPLYISLAPGRNTYSQKSLYINTSNNVSAYYFTKNIPSSLSELYFRVFFKYDIPGTNGPARECISLVDNVGNTIISLYNSSIPLNSWNIYVRKNGTYASVGSVVLTASQWTKIEFYLKINSSSGAYEVRIDNTTVFSESAINTGSANISTVKLGENASSNININVFFDDIAINDTTGTINNSWCGSGTIVGLKPKGSGNSSQWDTSQGWIKAESGTGTTTLKITGHGLATNDVIFNVTRNSYSIVTVVDANTLTTSTIALQAENDVIQSFTYSSTISATTGTTSSLVALSGHNLISGDVFVNTTRSNAIRKVIFVNGNSVYNALGINGVGGSTTLGSTVTSQASGDSIKIFKVKQYAVSNHYEAVNSATPNSQYSNIQSTTSNDIDLFNMQELTADLGIPSNAVIVAVSNNIYAREKGAGTQIKSVLRSGSTNDEGSTITLAGGTLEYQTVYDTSPFTSSRWTRSEVDGLEAGVKVV